MFREKVVEGHDFSNIGPKTATNLYNSFKKINY